MFKLKNSQVKEYIHSHLDQNLSLAQLAAIARMSPHYFATYCYSDRAQVIFIFQKTFKHKPLKPILSRGDKHAKIRTDKVTILRLSF